MSSRPPSPHKLPTLSELKGSRIALYGLSANPPTIAHRNIIAHLCSKRIFDEIAQILSRLPKLINDFEKAQERQAPQKATLWPGQIALLALLIAIISFFT
mgnify:CR=1 FL=1